MQEGGTVGAELVRQDFDIGHAAVIVDRDVDVLPANGPRGASTIAVDPMAELADASEWVDMQEIA